MEIRLHSCREAGQIGIGSEASPATLTSDEGQMESKGEFPPHVHVVSHELGLPYTGDP